jgi:preprotein translocase subunit YajC
MQSSEHPKFKIGDRVRILAGGLSGNVTEIDPQQSAYVVEINGNPEFLLFCTENELRLFSSTCFRA